MNLMQFHRMRAALQINASPGRGRDLEPIERQLRRRLVESGLFDEVEVGCTEDPDRLVIALCRFRRCCTEADVAASLERIWTDRVCYRFWEAHAVRAGNGHVEFEAASRVGVGGHYVTVHLVAERTVIPSQRDARADRAESSGDPRRRRSARPRHLRLTS